MSRFEVLGKVCWLYSHSPLHKAWSMEVLDRIHVPAIIHAQYRLFEVDGSPVAWLCWAWLGEEARAKYIEDPDSLAPKDWRSGSYLWFIDLCAPFGHLPLVKQELRSSEFKGETANFLRVKAGKTTGRLGRVVDVHGR